MSLKELEQIIKLCRKTGVASITIEGVTLTLTPDAPVSSYKRRSKAVKTPEDPFLKALEESKDVASRAKAKYIRDQQQNQPEPTSEQPDELAMLLWSAGGGDGAPNQ